MQEVMSDLKIQLSALENLHLFEAEETAVFKRKLEILKNIVLALAEEIESLEAVRTVNLRRGINLHEEMRLFEIHLIQSALERTGGHQTRAAQMLGINLTTLHNKLKRLNISPEAIVNAPVLHEDANGINHGTEKKSGIHAAVISYLEDADSRKPELYQSD
jgi:Response regulator containing CheY-like receiver, AAA-type ATPase, and DNA-binding domains